MSKSDTAVAPVVTNPPTVTDRVTLLEQKVALLEGRLAAMKNDVPPPAPFLPGQG